MPRRRVAAKRDIIPDPKFNNVRLAKFMNHVMVSGKKSVAERIVYGALEIVEKKLNKDQTIELMVIKTRQYAKRQATWARGKMKNWKTVSVADTKLSLKKLLN